MVKSLGDNTYEMYGWAIDVLRAMEKSLNFTWVILLEQFILRDLFYLTGVILICVRSSILRDCILFK